MVCRGGWVCAAAMGWLHQLPLGPTALKFGQRSAFCSSCQANASVGLGGCGLLFRGGKRNGSILLLQQPQCLVPLPSTGGLSYAPTSPLSYSLRGPRPPAQGPQLGWPVTPPYPGYLPQQVGAQTLLEVNILPFLFFFFPSLISVSHTVPLERAFACGSCKILSN